MSDAVDGFLEWCKTHDYGPYYDQWFCEFFESRYAWAYARLEDPAPLTEEEKAEMALLLWQDERLQMVGDWRLARDHNAPFVYSLAVRLLSDATAAAMPGEE